MESSTHTGAMIALMVPNPELYALNDENDPRATPENELHLTLAYLGESSEISHEERAAIVDAVSTLADTNPEIIALFPATQGVFGPDPESVTPEMLDEWEAPNYIAPANTEYFNNLREDLLVHLGARGVGNLVSTKHPVFTPHVTLTYAPMGQSPDLDYLPTPYPTVFSNIVVKFGDEIHSFNLQPSDGAKDAAPLTASALGEIRFLSEKTGHSTEYLTALYLQQSVKGSSTESKQSEAIGAIKRLLSISTEGDERARLLFQRAELESDPARQAFLASRARALLDRAEKSGDVSQMRRREALTASLDVLLAASWFFHRRGKQYWQPRNSEGNWIDKFGVGRIKIPNGSGGVEWLHGVLNGGDAKTGKVTFIPAEGPHKGKSFQVEPGQVSQPKAMLGRSDLFKEAGIPEPKRATQQVAPAAQRRRDASSQEIVGGQKASIESLNRLKEENASKSKDKEGNVVDSGNNVAAAVVGKDARDAVAAAKAAGKDTAEFPAPNKAPFKGETLSGKVSDLEAVQKHFDDLRELNLPDNYDKMSEEERATADKESAQAAIRSLVGEMKDQQNPDLLAMRRTPVTHLDKAEETQAKHSEAFKGEDAQKIAGEISDKLHAAVPDDSPLAKQRDVFMEDLKRDADAFAKGDLTPEQYMEQLDKASSAASTIEPDKGANDQEKAFGDLSEQTADLRDLVETSGNKQQVEKTAQEQTHPAPEAATPKPEEQPTEDHNGASQELLDLQDKAIEARQALGGESEKAVKSVKSNDEISSALEKQSEAFGKYDEAPWGHDALQSADEAHGATSALADAIDAAGGDSKALREANDAFYDHNADAFNKQGEEEGWLDTSSPEEAKHVEEATSGDQTDPKAISQDDILSIAESYDGEKLGGYTAREKKAFKDAVNTVKNSGINLEDGADTNKVVGELEKARKGLHPMAEDDPLFESLSDDMKGISNDLIKHGYKFRDGRGSKNIEKEIAKESAPSAPAPKEAAPQVETPKSSNAPQSSRKGVNLSDAQITKGEPKGSEVVGYSVDSDGNPVSLVRHKDGSLHVYGTKGFKNSGLHQVSRPYDPARDAESFRKVEGLPEAPKPQETAPEDGGEPKTPGAVLKNTLKENGWTEVVDHLSPVSRYTRGRETASFRKVYTHDLKLRIKDPVVNGRPVKGGYKGLLDALSTPPKDGQKISDVPVPSSKESVPHGGIPGSEGVSPAEVSKTPVDDLGKSLGLDNPDTAPKPASYAFSKMDEKDQKNFANAVADFSDFAEGEVFAHSDFGSALDDFQTGKIDSLELRDRMHAELERFNNDPELKQWYDRFNNLIPAPRAPFTPSRPVLTGPTGERADVFDYAHLKDLLKGRDALVMDFETTGLDVHSSDPQHGPAEISIKRVRDGKVIDEFKSLINPGEGRKMDPKASEITGITDEDLASAPSMADVWGQIKDFTGGDQNQFWVAHNATFDEDALKQLAAAAGETVPPRNVLDTMQMARDVFPKGSEVNGHTIDGHSLEKLTKSLGIENPTAHRAEGDTAATAELLNKLFEAANDKTATDVLGDLKIRNSEFKGEMADFPAVMDRYKRVQKQFEADAAFTPAANPEQDYSAMADAKDAFPNLFDPARTSNDNLMNFIGVFSDVVAQKSGLPKGATDDLLGEHAAWDSTKGMSPAEKSFAMTQAADAIHDFLNDPNYNLTGTEKLQALEHALRDRAQKMDGLPNEKGEVKEPDAPRSQDQIEADIESAAEYAGEQLDHPESDPLDPKTVKEADDLIREEAEPSTVPDDTRTVASEEKRIAEEQPKGELSPETKQKSHDEIEAAQERNQKRSGESEATPNISEELANAVKEMEDAGIPLQLDDEKFPLNDEQALIAHKAVVKGDSFVVAAKAGTGKTTTLVALGKRFQKTDPNKRGIYVAFNKSVQVEGEARMPKNVNVRTWHKLAYDNTPKWLTGKGNSKDTTNNNLEVARDILGIDGYGSHKKARLVRDMIDNYTRSADKQIGEQHFIMADGTDLSGGMSDEEKKQYLDWANKLWGDINDPKGKYKVSPNDVRKVWALTDPDLGKLGFHFLFVDEAQDTPPVLGELVKAQTIQKVIVGDKDQSINGWAGAVDYLSKANEQLNDSLPLSTSYRYGKNIEDIANRILQSVGSDERVIGGGPEDHIVSAHEMPDDFFDAILTRTNAGVIAAIADQLDKGRKVAVPKGTKKDFLSLINSMDALSKGRKAYHDDIAQYSNWNEFVQAAEEGDARAAMLKRLWDENGYDGLKDLLKNVYDPEMPSGGASIAGHDVVPSFGDDSLQIWGSGTYLANQTLKNSNIYLPKYGFSWDRTAGGEKKGAWVFKGTPEEQKAAWEKLKQDAKSRGISIEESSNFGEDFTPDVTISTAHKSKGLEWDNVQIAGDFKIPETDENGNLKDIDPEEKRLQYVAVTRAAKNLDPGPLSYIYDMTDENGGGSQHDVEPPRPEVKPDEAERAAREAAKEAKDQQEYIDDLSTLPDPGIKPSDPELIESLEKGKQTGEAPDVHVKPETSSPEAEGVESGPTPGEAPGDRGQSDAGGSGPDLSQLDTAGLGQHAVEELKKLRERGVGNEDLLPALKEFKKFSSAHANGANEQEVAQAMGDFSDALRELDKKHGWPEGAHLANELDRRSGRGSEPNAPEATKGEEPSAPAPEAVSVPEVTPEEEKQSKEIQDAAKDAPEDSQIEEMLPEAAKDEKVIKDSLGEDGPISEEAGRNAEDAIRRTEDAAEAKESDPKASDDEKAFAAGEKDRMKELGDLIAPYNAGKQRKIQEDRTKNDPVVPDFVVHGVIDTLKDDPNNVAAMGAARYFQKKLDAGEPITKSQLDQLSEFFGNLSQAKSNSGEERADMHMLSLKLENTHALDSGNGDDLDSMFDDILGDFGVAKEDHSNDKSKSEETPAAPAEESAPAAPETTAPESTPAPEEAPKESAPEAPSAPEATPAPKESKPRGNASPFEKDSVADALWKKQEQAQTSDELNEVQRQARDFFRKGSITSEEGQKIQDRYKERIKPFEDAKRAEEAKKSAPSEANDYAPKAPETPQEPYERTFNPPTTRDEANGNLRDHIDQAMIRLLNDERTAGLVKNLNREWEEAKANEEFPTNVDSFVGRVRKALSERLGEKSDDLGQALDDYINFFEDARRPDQSIDREAYAKDIKKQIDLAKFKKVNPNDEFAAIISHTPMERAHKDALAKVGSHPDRPQSVSDVLSQAVDKHNRGEITNNDLLNVIDNMLAQDSTLKGSEKKSLENVKRFLQGEKPQTAALRDQDPYYDEENLKATRPEDLYSAFYYQLEQGLEGVDFEDTIEQIMGKEADNEHNRLTAQHIAQAKEHVKEAMRAFENADVNSMVSHMRAAMENYDAAIQIRKDAGAPLDDKVMRRLHARARNMDEHLSAFEGRSPREQNNTKSQAPAGVWGYKQPEISAADQYGQAVNPLDYVVVTKHGNAGQVGMVISVINGQGEPRALVVYEGASDVTVPTGIPLSKLQRIAVGKNNPDHGKPGVITTEDSSHFKPFSITTGRGKNSKDVTVDGWKPDEFAQAYDIYERRAAAEDGELRKKGIDPDKVEYPRPAPPNSQIPQVPRPSNEGPNENPPTPPSGGGGTPKPSTPNTPSGGEEEGASPDAGFVKPKEVVPPVTIPTTPIDLSTIDDTPDVSPSGQVRDFYEKLSNPKVGDSLFLMNPESGRLLKYNFTSGRWRSEQKFMQFNARGRMISKPDVMDATSMREKVSSKRLQNPMVNTQEDYDFLSTSPESNVYLGRRTVPNLPKGWTQTSPEKAIPNPVLAKTMMLNKTPSLMFVGPHGSIVHLEGDSNERGKPIYSDKQIQTLLTDMRIGLTMAKRASGSVLKNPEKPVIINIPAKWTEGSDVGGYVMGWPGKNGSAMAFTGMLNLNPQNAFNSHEANTFSYSGLQGHHFMPAVGDVPPSIYTIVHEMGHLVDHHSGSPSQSPSALSMWKRDVLKNPMLPAYSKENAYEGYAEAFAQWAIGGGYASDGGDREHRYFRLPVDTETMDAAMANAEQYAGTFGWTTPLQWGNAASAPSTSAESGATAGSTGTGTGAPTA